MIKKIKIGSFRCELVFRHIWEGDSDDVFCSNYTVYEMKKKKSLGIWFKKDMIVGPARKTETGTSIDTFSPDNLVNNYMLGFDLIAFKIWFDFRFKPTLGTK
jgi:hypothetical protein